MLNVKINPELKEDAQNTANNLGLPLSIVINNFLKEFVQEKRVVFSDSPIPNLKTQKIIKETILDIKQRKNLSPSFTKSRDAFSYLTKK